MRENQPHPRLGRPADLLDALSRRRWVAQPRTSCHEVFFSSRHGTRWARRCMLWCAEQGVAGRGRPAALLQAVICMR